MKQFLSVCILITACLFLFVGCGNAAETRGGDDDGNGLTVVATNFPGYDFARAVVGDKGEVSMLLAPGEETHSFDPTPADIIAIENSDVFLYVGGESDDWVRNLLSSVDRDSLRAVSLMESVSLYEEETKEGMMSRGHDHGEGKEEEAHVAEADEHKHEHEAEYDEHVWTSVKNAAVLVKTVEDNVCAIDPENAAYYHQNAAAYIEELTKLDADFHKVAEQSQRQTILFGDRFPFLYFVREYGLDYYAAFPGCSSETEPNAATIAFLIDKGNAENVPVILKEKMSNGNIASAIAEETGSKVLSFYACGNIPAADFEKGETYLSLMEKNLAVLKEALN